MPRQGVSETDPLWLPWAIHWTCRMGYLYTLEYQFEYLCISLSLDWKFHQLTHWSSCQALNSKACLGQSSRSSHPYTPLCFRSVFLSSTWCPQSGAGNSSSHFGGEIYLWPCLYYMHVYFLPTPKSPSWIPNQILPLSRKARLNQGLHHYISPFSWRMRTQSTPG